MVGKMFGAGEHLTQHGQLAAYTTVASLPGKRKQAFALTIPKPTLPLPTPPLSNLRHEPPGCSSPCEHGPIGGSCCSRRAPQSPSHPHPTHTHHL